ncbi:hypothetical protein T06_8644 [Trichinella sp. T6]|nr:hypothetical protein T06_8644 [Trichinella sp. T6]
MKIAAAQDTPKLAKNRQQAECKFTVADGRCINQTAKQIPRFTAKICLITNRLLINLFRQSLSPMAAFCKLVKIVERVCIALAL